MTGDFLIKYRYSKEVAREALLAWWRKKFQTATLIFAVMGLIFLIPALVFRSPIWIFPALVSLLGAFGYVPKAFQGLAREMSAVRALYHIDQPSIVIEIGPSVLVKVSNRTKEHSFEEVEGYLYSRHLMVLMLAGNQNIAFPLDGFVRGSASDLEAFLESRGVKRR